MTILLTAALAALSLTGCTGNGVSPDAGYPLERFSLSVGDYVNQGDIIGYVGSTGWSTGAHLHFEVFYGGANVNPMDYISI